MMKQAMKWILSILALTMLLGLIGGILSASGDVSVVDDCFPDEPVYAPDMPQYHCNEGNSYYIRKQYDLALAAYQKAIEIDRSYHNAYYGVAITYRAQGRLDLAIANYSEVIRLLPDYAQPYASRAELYQCMGLFDDAESDLDSYVKLYSQYPISYIARGDFFMDRRDYHRAAKDYSNAVKVAPRLLVSYTKSAEALLLSGRQEDASSVFTQAIALARVQGLADAGEIDTILLTQSSSFGVEGETDDTVRNLVPDADLIALLYEHGFFDMPEYLDTGVMDGHFTWIMVHFKNGVVKRVGGLVAEEFGPDGFIAIYDAVVEALDDR